MPGSDFSRRPGRTLGAVAPLLLILGVAPAARAGELGTCAGVDTIEANLQTSSSGYYIPGLKLIIMNRARLEGFALPVQKFIFSHECAHHDAAVGEDEDAADCAAAKRGRVEGWLGKSEVIQVCVHLSRMPVDSRHKPAFYRCANIRRCMDEAERREHSNEQALLPSDILRR